MRHAIVAWVFEGHIPIFLTVAPLHAEIPNNFKIRYLYSFIIKIFK